MDHPPVILVTGASSGIGAQTARYFGRRGYRVILAARRQVLLEQVARDIESQGGSVLPMTVDLTNLRELQHLSETALDVYGQVDILFNNAGFGRLKWLDQMDPFQDIEMQLRTNLIATIHLTRLILPHMIERQSGHIINMASMAGFIGTPTYSIYAASKFALRGFSEALRREVSVHHIHVSVIYPGAVETEFKEQIGYTRKTGLTTPARLRLSSEQVAQAVWNITQKPRSTTIMPGMMRLAILLNNLAPGIVDRIITRRFTIPERFGKSLG